MVRFRNSATRYGLVARILHWSSVGILLVTVVLGSELEKLDDVVVANEVIGTHSFFGLVLLGIMLLRLCWRMANANPVQSYLIAAWQKRAAISVHWFIYSLVIVQCCIGIAQLFMDGTVLTIFERVTFDLPALGDSEMGERLNDVHAQFAKLLYVTIALHVSAAIYHQVFAVVGDEDHDNDL